jgi:hypothetical protein
MKTFDDSHVDALPDSELVAVVRAAISAHGRGELVAPARTSAPLGQQRLVVTAGALTGRWFGYRTYDTIAVEASWLDEALHVSTLGPNAVGASELPPEVLEQADIVVTDSRAQLQAYVPSHIGAGRSGVVELGDLLNDPSPVRRPTDGLSVFLSTGLAGTEVAIAVHLAETAGRSSR